MSAPASSDGLLFEGFRLDQRAGGLFRSVEDGTEIPVALGSRALDLLAFLIERRGDVVRRAEIFAAVWPGMVVEDSNLTVQIAALRRVLDQGRVAGSCIQTIAGRGYRFIAPVIRCATGKDEFSTPSAANDARPTEPPPSIAPAERRQLTAMICDLAGSMALSSRLDPEELREIVVTYQRDVANIVANFDGVVSSYMVDGVLVYFGFPIAHEDDAERAVRAGLAVIDAVGHLVVASVPLQTQVGIATGVVIVGDPTNVGLAGELSVVGEAPHLAARLKRRADPDTVVIADSTRRHLGALFDLEDLGAQPLAGFAEPQRAWRVTGESGAVSRFEALRSVATPLVGRDEELELLLRRWQQSRAGQGRAVLISGEPGIGKSRLTAALSERLATDPHARLRYFCSPYRQDSALYPFITQLERAAGFARDNTAEAKCAKLAALLAPDTTPDDSELIAELLSLPNAAAALNLSPQRKRERLLEALLGQLSEIARERPVLMVFEDAHWIDPTTRELIDLTIERLRRLPVLLLVTFRPEFQHGWGGQPHVTILALNRLGEREVAALVTGLAGNAALGSAVIKEIVERTDGVPLFVEELTKAVLERAGQDNRVAAVLSAAPLPAFAVPATLHASLLARLDRRGSSAKEVAQIAAAVGREFGYELIERVAQRPDLDAALGHLTEAGLLFCRGAPPQSSYLFKHALVQDAAYGTLLRTRRQELHARVATVLEREFADLAERQPELLAHHLAAAGDNERAVEQWLKAGKYAARASRMSRRLPISNAASPCWPGCPRPLRATPAKSNCSSLWGFPRSR